MDKIEGQAHEEHVGDDVGEGEGDEGEDGKEDAEDFADDVLGRSGLPDAKANHVVAKEGAQHFLTPGRAGLVVCHCLGVPGGCSVVKQIRLQHSNPVSIMRASASAGIWSGS